MLLLAALGCAHHPAQEQSAIDPRAVAWIHGEGVPVAPPAQCAKFVPTLEQIGTIMYQRDQAAWHGTDAAEGTFRLLQAQGGPSFFSKGWLVEQHGDKLAVEWVTERSGAPEVVLTVDVARDYTAGAAHVEGLVDGFLLPDGSFADNVDLGSIMSSIRTRPLTVSEAAQLQALQLAFAQNIGPQPAEATNVIAVPVEDYWLVYLMAATMKPDVLVLGGAVEVVVQNGQIVNTIHHGQNVYSIPVTKVPGASNIGFLDIPSMACPSETFVFSSLQYDNLPIVLVGSEGIWGIRGAEMTFLGGK